MSQVTLNSLVVPACLVYTDRSLGTGSAGQKVLRQRLEAIEDGLGPRLELQGRPVIGHFEYEPLIFGSELDDISSLCGHE